MEGGQGGKVNKTVAITTNGNGERARGAEEPGIEGCSALKVMGWLPGAVVGVVGPLHTELEAMAGRQALRDNAINSVFRSDASGKRPGIISGVSIQARARNVTDAAAEGEADVDACGWPWGPGRIRSYQPRACVRGKRGRVSVRRPKRIGRAGHWPPRGTG